MSGLKSPKKISEASRAEDTATGLVQGNPVSVAIAERDTSLLPVITNALATALKSPDSAQGTSGPRCGRLSLKREADNELAFH
jgi:hypothetical protein